MRGLLWQTEGKGDTYDVVAIPDDYLEAAREWRDRLVGAHLRERRGDDGAVPRGTEPGREAAHRRDPAGHDRRRGHPGAVRQRVQEQGRAADAGRDRGLLPSPLDIPAVVAHAVGSRGHDVVERAPDPVEPFAALAFKIMSDQHLGKLTYIRIYSGTLESGTAVLNSTKGRKERIGKIYQMHANKREERPSAIAGQIVAVMGLKDTTTGDTLCEPGEQVILESMTFPAPVINVAIEPRTKGDQDKLGTAIQRLAEEDPTLQGPTASGETGEPSSPAWANCTLRCWSTRVRREFKVEANIGRPPRARQVHLKTAMTSMTILTALQAPPPLGKRGRPPPPKRRLHHQSTRPKT